jgi:hypothetical protein
MIIYYSGAEAVSGARERKIGYTSNVMTTFWKFQNGKPNKYFKKIYKERKKYIQAKMKHS